MLLVGWPFIHGAALTPDVCYVGQQLDVQCKTCVDSCFAGGIARLEVALQTMRGYLRDDARVAQ